MAVVSALAGIVGARVFDILDNLDRFVADPISMILTRTGFSIYGGLFFGIMAGAIFVKRRWVPVTPMLDATAPAMMLGYGIGRLGCQIAGDGDWGIAANIALKPSWLPEWILLMIAYWPHVLMVVALITGFIWGLTFRNAIHRAKLAAAAIR
jgi:phosphatidylglycerol:prolipoprotein diacylglycerol transferase